MGYIKISELPEATTFNDDDVFPIVQSGVTKKVSKDNMGFKLEDVSFDVSGISVSPSSSTNTNATGFVDSCLVYYLIVTPSGISDTYDIKIYSKDTFLSADLFYSAVGISSASPFEDRLVFFYKDSDLTQELHVKITNNDVINTGTFSITINAQRFS